MRFAFCPYCYNKLTLGEGKYSLQCSNCHKYFPIIEGCPILLLNHLDSRSRIQQEIYDRKWASSRSYQITKVGEGINLTLTYRESSEYIRQIPLNSESIVLDIGCGLGTNLNEIVYTRGAKGVGIDISIKSISSALTNNFLENEFYVANAEMLPFPENTFSLILCLDVLEHLKNPCKAVIEIFRCLKPEGYALIHMPVTDIKGSLDWLMLKIRPSYWRQILSEAGHDYEYMLTADKLLDIISEKGFKILFANRFNVWLQNYFDYHAHLIWRMLELVFVRGIRWKGIRHPIPINYYHNFVMPIMEFSTFIDRAGSKLNIGASIYVLIQKPQKE